MSRVGPNYCLNAGMSCSVLILFVLAISGLITGCVPIPRKSVVRYGVQGSLEDSGTATPLAKSQVVMTLDGEHFRTKTNRKGEFSVPPEMHHFWTWLGGAIWMDATRVTVEISLDDYLPYQRTFIVRTESAHAPVPEDEARLSGHYVDLGAIDMNKRWAAATGEGEPTVSQQTLGTNIVRIEEEMTFRRVSPGHYQSNAKDFFLLETEVTNEMYERYLKSTGRTKGDTELADSERSRAESTRRSGRSTFTTASPVYDPSNPALLWTNNKPPRGTGNFPVALITRGDAEAFCEWLTSRYSQVGRFRLPTVEEWLIAAYGSARKYPWGDEWSFDIPCISRSEKERRTSPEPVKAHEKDKTPEEIYGLWGNVGEYVVDPIHFPNDTRWMGPSFKRYPTEGMFPFVPRNEWWGYVHNSASRQEDIGFRVLLEPK